MYFLYFKNSEGVYHIGIAFEELHDAIEMAVKYICVAPQIMITNSSDQSVFEAENGEIVFPEEITIIAPTTTTGDISFSHDDYCDLIEELDRFPDLTDEYVECLSLVMAAAARDNINLRYLGWEPK
ncbi:hypothetical protein ACSV5M_20295 [Cellvibrio sp. ARAG 10.3]|uniref:hypothetical protein n=1 Tax=Cellvibrio sp. ARAG 10.3 TaxID=3451358 RepID=UPI003F47251C